MKHITKIIKRIKLNNHPRWWLSEAKTTVAEAQSVTCLSPKAANELIRIFNKQNILREITGYKRNRIFVFHEYRKLFSDQGIYL